MTEQETIDCYRDQFKIDLDALGESCGLNGARYETGTARVPAGRELLAVKRTWRGQSENIIGFNGREFRSRHQAILWALMDSQLIMSPGKTVPERNPVQREAKRC